jgi:hypothetical protein
MILYGRNLGFLDLEPLLFLPRSSSTHEPEWTPFQIYYFSEKAVAPGIEPRPLDVDM